MDDVLFDKNKLLRYFTKVVRTLPQATDTLLRIPSTQFYRFDVINCSIVVRI